MKIDIKGSMPQKTEKVFFAISKIPEIQNWTLIGGTALSIHLKHRLSEDLDFFIYDNRLNPNIKKNIDYILHIMQNKGYKVKGLYNEDENIQQDYSVDGVKITFCASRDFNYKQDTISYENIDISNIKSISAMKMLNILKYRTKSRDFYDIKTFIDKDIYDFRKLVSNFTEFFPNKFFDKKAIEFRFTKKTKDIDDEGLDNLVEKNCSFEELQLFFKQLILKQTKADSILLNEILGSKRISPIFFKQAFFNLSNDSLLMSLFEAKKDNLLIQLLSNSNSDLKYRNIEGKNLLEMIIEDENKNLFNKSLFYLDKLEDFIVEKVKNHPSLNNILEKHRLLNRLFLKEDNYILDFIEKKELPLDSFLKDIEDKRNIFNKKELPLNRIVATYEQFLEPTLTLKESKELIEKLQEDSKSKIKRDR